jgi:3-deoxy-D-manno-octulosonic-acid transferase
LHNFKTVTDALQARGAMAVVETPEALAQAVLQLWSDQSLRMARISAATAYLQSEQGVLGRVLSAIE